MDTIGHDGPVLGGPSTTDLITTMPPYLRVRLYPSSTYQAKPIEKAIGDPKRNAVHCFLDFDSLPYVNELT